jgi:hypothetical protein
VKGWWNGSAMNAQRRSDMCDTTKWLDNTIEEHTMEPLLVESAYPVALPFQILLVFYVWYDDTPTRARSPH